MCLTIDTDLHRKRNFFERLFTRKSERRSPYKAKKATRDIRVYKVLSYDMCAPYFSYLQYEYSKTETSPMRRGDFFSTDIEEGLHSIRSERKCNIMLSAIDDAYPFMKLQVVYAVIPKGAEYYYGIDGDLVSNKLRIIRPLSNQEYEELRIVVP